MSSKERALEGMRHAAAFVILTIGLVGYLSAAGAIIYFGFVTLSHAVAGH
jgi:hypothetical protein